MSPRQKPSSSRPPLSIGGSTYSVVFPDSFLLVLAFPAAYPAVQPEATIFDTNAFPLVHGFSSGFLPAIRIQHPSTNPRHPVNTWVPTNNKIIPPLDRSITILYAPNQFPGCRHLFHNPSSSRHIQITVLRLYSTRCNRYLQILPSLGLPNWSNSQA